MRLSIFGISIASLAVPCVLIACGGTAVSTTDTSDGGPPQGRVPQYHRPVHQDCAAPVPENGVQASAGKGNGAPCPAPDPTKDTCGGDSECTGGAGGKCVQQCVGGKQCVYDQCQKDNDCTPVDGQGDRVCACGGGQGGVNTCRGSGNCQVDANCPGSYCSPSLGSCGTFGGTVGFFCHSAKDECVDDKDCNLTPGITGSYCMFDETATHWKCSSSLCAG